MDILSKRGIRTPIRLSIAALCLMLLLTVGTLSAHADGGGFPTNTPIPPTFTPLPTSTTTPTRPAEGQLLLPFASPTIAALPDGSSLLGIQAPTPIPVQSPRAGVSLLACWPFALVVLAVLIIGIWWLRNRLAQDAYESME